MKLVTTDGDRVYTTSRIIAENGEVQHQAIMKLVRNYSDDLKSLSTSGFEIRKFKTAGRGGEEALLDEIQATFIITLMKNSKKVVQFKKELTKQFFKQREIISRLVQQQKDPSWVNVRRDGKQVYFQKTDIIKDFVEYATSQGSKSAKMYYINFAKMENSALFFMKQKYPNLRELLTIIQLMQVATADTVIEKAIKEGMEQEIFYKDIYKLAKERIIVYAELVGKSPVLQLGENNETNR